MSLKNSNIEIHGTSNYLDTEEFCIYAAKNPFWADCKSNELICKVKDRNAIAVNIVDADDSKYFKVAMFNRLVRIIDEKVKNGGTVHIICNKGQSRSASIALLYLSAKGIISKTSYEKARHDFEKLYPNYLPGIGISKFLDKTWGLFFRPVKRPPRENKIYSS